MTIFFVSIFLFVVYNLSSFYSWNDMKYKLSHEGFETVYYEYDEIFNRYYKSFYLDYILYENNICLSCKNVKYKHQIRSTNLNYNAC